MSRIVTWNVNGARSLAPTPQAFRTLLDSFEADVICLQETKIARDKLHAHQDVALVPGYDVFFSCSRVSGKSAYAGVATYCRSNALPVAAEEGFTGRLTNVAAGRAWDTIGGSLPPFSNFSEAELLAFDNEGRCVITDHVDFVLFNIYFPATGETDARYVFKINFYYALQERVTALIDSGRHVIIVGDVNATYAPIDHVRWNQPRAAVSFAAGVRLPGGEVTAVGGVVGAAVTNSSNGGGALEADPAFPELEDMETSPATKWMRAMLVSGGGHFIDTFRVFHPTQEQAYTCWNNLTNARASNYGTRLDYVLADAALVTRGFFADVRIRPDVMGSDHCPVVADLTVKLAIAPHQAPALCTKYMKELSGKQTSLKELFQARAASSTPVTAAATPSDAGSVGSDGASDTPSHATPTPTPTPSGSTATPLARGAGSGGAGVAKQAKLNAFFTRTAKPGASTSASAAAQGKGKIETTFTPMDTVAPTMIDRGITPTSDLDGSSDQPMPDAVTTSTSMTAVRSEALAAVGVVEATAAANSAAAASAWRALLDTTPKQVTCRGHGEPCILLTVNKKGPNTGRKFYMCARPVGDKHDPAARCDFFAWATQLKGHGARIVKSLPGKAAAQSDRDRARPYPDRSGGPAGV